MFDFEQKEKKKCGFLWKNFLFFLPFPPLTLLTFLLSLLTYSILLVSIMISCLYILQSNHHNKSSSHLSLYIGTKFFFSCDENV